MLRVLTAICTLALCLALLFAAPAPASAFSQDQPTYQPQDQPPPQDQDQGPGYQGFSPDQLDNLLSPIALYPDPLLAQVFVAATFPDQVEEAARFVRGNGTNGVDYQDWDVSVKAVAHYPAVIGMMADKIDWTTSVGQAYVNQSTDVASSVQHLRHLARQEGNLVSTPQQEVLEHDDYIAINPYQPEYIYVPVYDPAIVYYRRPYWGPAIAFGVGFPIGAWLNLDFRWGYGGGWGGVYYTGWRREGWGHDCWNCGWIGRSRGRVNIQNNVYINNRYTNITVNRTVINRTVNVNNLNRYNSVHRNVNYNNVQVNNERANRVGNHGFGRGDRPTGNNGNNGNNGDRRGNNSYNGDRPNPGANNRPPVTNQSIDRNIDRSNPNIDRYRGRDNNARTDRPPDAQQRPMPGPAQRMDNRPGQMPQVQQPQASSSGNQQRPMPGPAQRMDNRPGQMPQVQQPQASYSGSQQRPMPGPAQRMDSRPAAQMPQVQQPQARPGPHTFNPNEGGFDPRASSQRGQASRQPPPQSRPSPPPRAQNNSAPASRGGGERRKP